MAKIRVDWLSEISPVGIQAEELELQEKTAASMSRAVAFKMQYPLDPPEYVEPASRASPHQIRLTSRTMRKLPSQNDSWKISSSLELR